MDSGSSGNSGILAEEQMKKRIKEQKGFGLLSVLIVIALVAGGAVLGHRLITWNDDDPISLAPPQSFDFVAPEGEPLYELYIDEPTTLDVHPTGNAWGYGQTFTPTDTLIMPCFSIQCQEKTGSDVTSVYGLLYQFDTNLASSVLLATSTNTINVTDLPEHGDPPFTSDWVTFDFDPNIILSANQEYCVIVKGTDGSTNCMFTLVDNPSFYSDAGPTTGEAWIVTADAHMNDYDCGFRIWAVAVDNTEVYTDPPKYGNNRTVTLGGHMSYTETEPFFEVGVEYGLSTGEYGPRYVIDEQMRTGVVGREYGMAWSKLFSSMKVDTTYYYRAYAIGGYTGNEIVGDERTFELDSDAVAPWFDVGVEDLGYDTAFHGDLYDLGTDSTVDITVFYGTTEALVVAEGSYFVIVDDADDIGRFTYTDEAGTFDAGNRYFYRGYAEGATMDGYTEMKSFLKRDPDKPSAQNAIEAWFISVFGGDNAGLIWWFVFGIFCLIGYMIALAKDNKAWFVIPCVIGLGILIILDTMNAWIVVAIALATGMFYGLKLLGARR